ncbi:MAG TPA: oxygenase MpaB family protein, partial [Actinomycetales bacterium]
MSRSAGDAGLYGPESVTWRLHADPIYGIAGLRALLLQALHPVAVHGVFEHSTFREDVWGRLANTAEFVGVTTYGSTVEAITMGARIRAIHMRVSGVEPTTGRSY